MVINVLANGDIKNIKPENIYQGSNKANTIYLLAPFSANVQALISFEIPQTHEIKGEFLFNAPTEVSAQLNMWTLDVEQVLTEYYGDVKYQIRFVNGTQVIATASGQFKVYQGVDVVLPDAPTNDVYQTIIKSLGDIQANFLNGWIEAQALRTYSSTFSYSLNALTYQEEYGEVSFYKSLVENNVGHPLHDTNRWKKIELGVGEVNAIDTISVNGVPQEIDSDKNVNIEVVTEEQVDNKLTGYYKKAETYSKDEVNNLVSAIPTFKVAVVNQLPTLNISTTTVYLVRSNNASPNLYDEYIYVNNQWEFLGSQSFNLTADTIGNLIEDSDSVVAMVDNGKVTFEVATELTNRIARALVTPMSAPAQTKLVAIDNRNSQTMLTIGEGLELQNGVLNATGGNGGGGVDDKASRKQLLLGADGVLNGNYYVFTVQNAEDFAEYKTNLTKFLMDLHLPIVGALDTKKEVAITFGNTTYYVYNILRGNDKATIGDLQQVDKYNNATGYRFITEMTFFETTDFVGFAIIPTISMSDVLALDSDQMDNYMADGGLTQGQLAICKKVLTNGYTEGAIYRFDVVYPDTYSWMKVTPSILDLNDTNRDLMSAQISITQIQNTLGNVGSLLDTINGEVI